MQQKIIFYKNKIKTEKTCASDEWKNKKEERGVEINTNHTDAKTSYNKVANIKHC